MWVLFLEYLGNLYRGVPEYVYWGVLSFYCFGLIFLCVIRGIKNGLHLSIPLFFVAYVFVLLCSTILYRHVIPERVIHLQPLWSYKAYSDGIAILFPENIMNVVVFIPIGLFVRLCFQSIRWWGVLMIGFVLSVFIEIIQYIFQKGTCDMDDVIHNTLGCIIGYIIYRFLSTRSDEYVFSYKSHTSSFKKR